MANSATTNKISKAKILAIYRKAANNTNEHEIKSCIEKLQAQCMAYGQKLSEIIDFSGEAHKVDLFVDINPDGTLVPKAAQTLYKLMGKYIKTRLKADPTYFDSMKKAEIIKDVKDHMDPKSKYYTKDPISCLKWYKAQIKRAA
jgi:hypothetical protein